MSTHFSQQLKDLDEQARSFQESLPKITELDINIPTEELNSKVISMVGEIASHRQRSLDIAGSTPLIAAAAKEMEQSLGVQLPKIAPYVSEKMAALLSPHQSVVS